MKRRQKAAIKEMTTVEVTVKEKYGDLVRYVFGEASSRAPENIKNLVVLLEEAFATLRPQILKEKVAARSFAKNYLSDLGNQALLTLL